MMIAGFLKAKELKLSLVSNTNKKQEKQMILIDGIPSRTEAELVTAHGNIYRSVDPAVRSAAIAKYYRAYDTLVLIFNYSLEDLRRIVRGGNAA